MPTSTPRDRMADAISGIGPGMAQALYDAGIDSLETLEATSEANLREALPERYRSLAHTLPSWPFQAHVARRAESGGDDDAEELDRLADRLRAGRATSKHLLVLRDLSPDAAEYLAEHALDTYAAIAAADEGALADHLAQAQHTLRGSVSELKEQAHFAASADWAGLLDYQRAHYPIAASTPPSTPPTPHPPSTGGTAMPALYYVDIDARNQAAREKLLDRRTALVNRIEEATAGGQLPDHRLQDEVRRIDFRLVNGRPPEATDDLPDYSALPPEAPAGVVVDPLFYAVADDVDVACDPNCNVTTHVAGRLYAEVPDSGGTTARVDPPAERANEFAYIYGTLLRDGVDRPSESEPFRRDLSRARSEYHANHDLADAVIGHLALAGQFASGDTVQGRLRAEQLAAVTRILRGQGVRADDLHLGLKVQAALARYAHDGDEATASSLEITLPDLGEQSGLEIQQDNLRAMQAIYFSAMLEEMRLFQVVDKLVEMYEYGMLPIVRGTDADNLYAYRRDRIKRLSEIERRNLYARALGQPGGEPHLQNQNREFQTLMIRFVAAVSSYARQVSVDALMRATVPGAVHQEQVRKAGCDLGSNLSLHAYGMAFNAAVELQRTLTDAIRILQGTEVKAAFGARDMYQVIEQVAALELGGLIDTTRYRTLADAGAIIIRWVERHASELCTGYGDVLNLRDVLHPGPRPSGSTPTTDPTDADLVSACERYLAVTGTSEAQVLEYASPYAGASAPSRPISIPSIARDALAGAGLHVGGDGFSFDSIGV